MNRLITILIAVATIACTRTTVIPDQELAQIFHDAFLANACTKEDRSIYDVDSMLIYEPIFEKYGYTKEDVQNTIGNFAKRKSARLSDIVELSIAMLESEGIEYSRQVAILDTIDNSARRILRERIFQRERIDLYNLRDTTKSYITIEEIKPGNYALEFDYLIDSLDSTYGSYTTSMWFERDGSKSEFHSHKSYLTRRIGDRFTHSVRISDNFDRLQIRLADPRSTNRDIHATLKRVYLTFTPTAEAATDSLFRSIMKINFFSDELLTTQQTDSL